MIPKAQDADTPTSAWVRSMAAGKGGYAVQRSDCAEGSTRPQYHARNAHRRGVCERSWGKWNAMTQTSWTAGLAAQPATRAIAGS
jgi:hypothetical protein